MDLQNIYFIMFNILNNFHKNNQINDSLGSLLSDMDPNIFTDGKPADPAIYDDWTTIFNKYAQEEKTDYNKIILAIKEFLMFYQHEFGYELKEAINYIENNLEVINQIKKSISVIQKK